MSFRVKRRRIDERSEKSRVHKVGVTEILRPAKDDNLLDIYNINIPLPWQQQPYTYRGEHRGRFRSEHS